VTESATVTNPRRSQPGRRFFTQAAISIRTSTSQHPAGPNLCDDVLASSLTVSQLALALADQIDNLALSA
jgi:hypothetical protein